MSLSTNGRESGTQGTVFTSSISKILSKKVEQAFKENVDAYISSDAFDAMEADVDMFGEKAFSNKKEET